MLPGHSLPSALQVPWTEKPLLRWPKPLRTSWGLLSPSNCVAAFSSSAFNSRVWSKFSKVTGFLMPVQREKELDTQRDPASTRLKSSLFGAENVSWAHCSHTRSDLACFPLTPLAPEGSIGSDLTGSHRGVLNPCDSVLGQQATYWVRHFTHTSKIFQTVPRTAFSPLKEVRRTQRGPAVLGEKHEQKLIFGFPENSFLP